MHRASTALRDATAEFGASHAEHIAQHPEQRHVARRVEGPVFTIDLQIHDDEPPPSKDASSSDAAIGLKM
jgi:hypothetical protein